ncbi:MULTISPECIES: fibronectin type III domain-containing protein [Chryseobacterium]|uniref:Fibronectin type-III domain-containing protein n=1 Tax=Chryseobacterium camelliae TaxID=1265445 RepID=A0ABU0TFM5_9FLAO|nr:MULTISPECIES: fibronectin type III domain-containing protein [Chryseobacterium]MDT3406340.1 hypothetical protein [Pseudacidovorax intermedius]MDQ1095861.1 hypothetical protein [Chryseobacterium camelliae]MDQ1099797.1 hypothetical protein [Chryseobacterium sp. SORGH_AS_1048]MDR6087144.1 hypothetical protein [Chryseobacterium sp. SORGH_AS_0909]MDR6131517.1 hypothetical protein [Chryseobacterium sp. SORGH_AS_1175]
MKKLLFFCLFLATGIAQAQVNAYTFTQTSGTYTPITGGTVLATASTANDFDSQNWTLPTGTIPFYFNFNGVFYSGLTINSNGFITFGSNLPQTFNTVPLSSTNQFAGAVSAFGGDLNASFVSGAIGSELRYETVGSAPNRVFVIQFKEWRPFYNLSTTNIAKISFQIRLEETTNKITTVYNDCGIALGTLTNTGSRQIGLRGSTNTDFNNRLNSNTVSFGSSTAGTSNSSSQAFSFASATPGLPANGLTYTWTPPTCLAPSSVAQTGATSSSADIQITAPAPVPANGYEYYYSTSNTPPTSTTVPSNSTTALNVSIGGLTAGTTYYIWVRSLCTTSDKSGWSPMGTFTTLCNTVDTIMENFDSYSTGSIVPTCWDKILIGANVTQSISSSTPASGTRNISQYNNTAGQVNIVTLPPLNTVNAGYQLSLKVRATQPSVLDIGYLTNPFDASSFVVVQTLNITNTSYGNASTIPFPTSVPASARVAVRMPPQATAGTIYWDDVRWAPSPSCLFPYSLVASNVTQTSATVSWTAPIVAPAGGYEYYYADNSTAPTATTVPSGITTSTSVSLTLSSATTYNVWVRSVCSSTDKSEWSPAVTLTTLCNAVATMTEGFESYSIAAIVPSCWNRLVAGSAATQAINSTTPASGSRNLYQSNSIPGQTNIVILPPFSTINSGYQLRFKVRASLAAVLEIGYMTNPADESTFTLVNTLNITNTSYGPDTIVPFPTSVPANARVAVRMPAQTTSPNIYWDDVNWEPASLSTSDISGHKNGISLYPNPFTDVLNISGTAEAKNVLVVDASGRIIKKIARPGSVLQLRDLNAGFYTIIIEMNDGTTKSIKTIKK